MDFPLKKGESEGGRVLVGISLTLLWPVKFLKLVVRLILKFRTSEMRNHECEFSLRIYYPFHHCGVRWFVLEGKAEILVS